MFVMSPSSFIKTWRSHSESHRDSKQLDQNLMKITWSFTLMSWIFFKLTVVRMKGEENSVMRDYVLPDFSSIKKGFCKVRKLVLVAASHFEGVWRLFIDLLSLFFSHERTWSSVESTRQESRSWGWSTSALLFLRCSSTRQTLASRRWASQRPSWTPSSLCLKVRTYYELSVRTYYEWTFSSHVHQQRQTCVSAIRHAATLLPEHRPDRREHFVSGLQRATGGRAAITRPRSPSRVRPAAFKVSLAV